jgi:hypothetical protein
MPKIKDLGIKVIPETMRPPEIGGGGGCTDCTMVQFSICGTTPGPGGGCTDCTYRPFSICGGTHCTAIHSLCGFPSYQGCGHPYTFIPCICTHIGSIPCPGFSGCGPVSPVCTASIINPGDPGINPQQIAALKEQLQKQIDALDEVAKAAGPKTAEEIDAREKQLNAELADLKARRKNLK